MRTELVVNDTGVSRCLTIGDLSSGDWFKLVDSLNGSPLMKTSSGCVTVHSGFNTSLSPDREVIPIRKVTVIIEY